MLSIKSLVESTDLTSIPSNYTFTKTPNDEAVILEDSEVKIPIIDFSLLTSDNQDQRSKTISELGKACQEWGFFMVTNHGVPDRVMSEVIEGCRRFFDLSEEEKREFDRKHVLGPTRYGTSFNASVEEVLYWRDFLRVFGHPQCHFPSKPSVFSENASDYCKRTRDVVIGILEGTSESLGLEANYIYKALNLDSGMQVFVANLYPPCPQPELAIGLPPHSDHGLLTFLIQNGISGLQIQHKGKWVNVNHNIPNSFLVNTADQLEVLSNGKYKSVVHRVVVNRSDTRISVGLFTGPALDADVGPALDADVGPASKLVKNHSPAYIGMKYKEYLELKQSSNLTKETTLERVRL